MASCAVPSVMAKDPLFQALKEAYKDKHYSDDHLAQALQLCREYHDYDMDWYPETSAQKGVFTRFMNYYLINAKTSKTASDLGRDTVYNLYTTLYAIYTPEQLDSRLNMIARDFREMVDRFEKNDNFSRSRQQIIKEFGDENENGYQKIMKRVFDLYQSHYTDVDKMMDSWEKRNPNATEEQKATAHKNFEYRAQEYRTVLANKERLAALAATRIGEDEGFIVSIRDFSITFEEPIEENQLVDGVGEGKENSGEDKEEGSKGERYGDFRTLKLLNTLSVRARRLISNIPKVDSTGKIVRDDLGVKQFVGGRQVATVLKRALVNSTPDSMISDLEAEAEFHPWVRGIIDEIRKNPDSRQTIYDNFKSAETTYVYVSFENGRYTPHIANSRSAGYALMREAGNNLRAGYVQNETTSIYTGYGSLKSQEEIDKIRAEFNDIKKLVQSEEGTLWIKMVDGDKIPSKYIEELIAKAASEGRDISYLRSEPQEAMSLFLSAHPEIPQKVAGFLRGMGFNVTAKDISTIAKQTMSPKGFQFLVGWRGRNQAKGRNKLYQLMDYMSAVYGRAEEIHKKNLTDSGQYLFNTTGAFQKINKALALAQYKDVEARVVNEGKSLSTYNHMNLLHQVFDMLMNKERRSEENYLQMMEEEYLRYEGMALGYGDQRQVHGWLRMLRDNENDIREKMRVIDIAAFNHVEYADMSRPQKLINSIIMYLEGGQTFQEDGFAAYEVPIQSDYSTAYNFILAPKMSEDKVVDALTNEVLMECERIALIEARQSDKTRVDLSTYEEQGMKFQIFPEFNDNGFRDEYKSQESPEEAFAFVSGKVIEQLEKIIVKDIATIEDAKVLMNPALKKVNFGYGNYSSLFSKDGKFDSLDEKAQSKLREYFTNVFYARQQITKLTVGGTEQFNGLIDFEKRNMLTHATRTSLDTRANWKGRRVGKDTQNVVYVEDDSSASAFFDSIKEMLDQLLDEKVISATQHKIMLKAYSKIKTTDGQGFRTLESYRIVQIMADQWDDAHELAYNRIMNPGKYGKVEPNDIKLFMQNIKPVLTGYEIVPAAVGENQKPVKLTVLHKYSEAVLLPVALAQHCLQAQSAPLRAFDKAQAQLKKQGKEIDIFLFHSGVKVGAHSVIQPFAKDNDGKRILQSEKGIEDYIVSSVSGKQSVIHTLPFKYYGIAASTPAHVANDKIAWASQAEKVAWANIRKGDKILVRGEEMDAWDARELYNAIKTANIVEAYKKIREFFTDTDELEKVFQEELASKSYSSRELQYALAHLKDGTFAIPLFSPNVEHQVQELLSSIIKKRLTKPKVKGANILQATGLGIDIEASSFDNNDALSEDEKLHIVFEGEGKNKRIKYVEVYMPIHDSRLMMFAEKDGSISAEKLKKLVDDGTIPESMLEFIAYRTPSDAEHSVIPCRIKGFVANTGGATIMMPKEIMVMTGHDYDGDKMRCHFKNFRLVDKEGDEIDSTTFMRMVMGQIPVNANMRRVEVYEYNYDKTPLENSQAARNNARVELMFSELTSAAGSRRMLIPGGCDESKVIAKTLYLVRAAKTEDIKKKIADILERQGSDSDKANAVVGSTTALYNTLIRKTDGELSDIVREVSSAETPFSVTHSADAFDYIMGGSQMIGVYAVYNSALQMLQRLDMSYVPRVTQKTNKPYTITLFGHTFGKLFEVTNHNGRLASLGLARLLNAAVDNNKDPVLGYLNQTDELAPMTFLMFAAGMTEEEIHLIMNQPSVIELAKRLKSRDSRGMITEISGLISELAGDNQKLGEITPWVSTREIQKMERMDYIKYLANSFEEIKNGQDYSALQEQIYILQTLAHLNNAAENLSAFVRLTRPESESGSIGTSVADIIAKEAELNKFRDLLDSSELSDIQISGMREVLQRRDVHEGWDTDYIEDILGLKLPEVVALNSLMLDSSLEMFKPYFPQAKQSWVKLATEIANQYSYKKIQEGTIARIGQEMILWKLLSNKKFVQGDPQEEQQRIIIDVPKQVKDLKERIARASQNPGKDTAADALVGNAFLEHLTATSPENSESRPRLQFSLNGAAVEGTRDMISASWGAMLNSSDESIKNLAIDLFRYNLYTNGFSYGMYEFAHFAPFSVLMSTPGYIEALRDVLKTDWNDENERENFVNQYYMNHWGDKKFLSSYNIAALDVTPDGNGNLFLTVKNDAAVIERISGLRYIVIRSGENGKTQMLYRVEPGTSVNPIILVKAQKLGVRNRNQQVTLQYNPSVDYHFIKPVVAGNDSAWGQIEELNVWATGNINAGAIRDGRPIEQVVADGAAAFFGIPAVAQQIEKLEEKAEPAVQSNDGVLDEIPNSLDYVPILPVNEAFSGLMGGTVDMEALQSAAVGGSNLGGKMLNIARRDESGKIVSEKVPATPNNVREARQQKAFVELNKKLREILRQKGIDVGTLTSAEARLAIGGVADFETANVTAEGLLEMIRIAEGYRGEQALPEEFAHIALEMLGHKHPLVERLLNALNSSSEAMQEAYEGMYDEYEEKYGKDNHDKLVLEAAGKLVAKQLLREQEIQSSPVRRLIHRIVDAIKSLFRKFNRDEVQNAIFDANDIASKVAREMLSGRLIDDMALENIGQSGQFLQLKKDLTGKKDILSRLLKTENKRLSILKKRLGELSAKSQSYAATELQIKKLESAITNYKTEEAIVTYIDDSLAYLAKTNESLDNVVASGRPVNAVCQKLNTVRETLDSFSQSLEDIEKAIESGEIQDSVELAGAIERLSGVLSKFCTKYSRLARGYFEEMLSSVYGEHGITVTVGKEKGRVISIHEMATRADHDISLASKWFLAIADCDDYVLKAVDEITRNAKIRARRQADTVRTQIEVAVANLLKETGSRDTSWMFQYEKGEDGKMHKNGKYITPEQAKSLSPAKRAFYNTIMSIKHDADKCIPDTLIHDENQIVMVRKYTMDRFKDAEGAKGKAIEAWEGLKNRIMDTSDNFDPDTQEVVIGFSNNKVDMLPVKFIKKGKNESFDDMSDDVATSVMAYAGMAYEYNELNGVVNILENAKYMAGDRDVIQKTGRRTQRESIETDDYSFKQEFTRKAVWGRAQEALESFFSMHIYGHTTANEGTFGSTRISKRKVVDTVNMLTSYSQMAINLPQRIANVSTGMTQIIIESIGKGRFGAKDVAWASKIYTLNTGDRLTQLGKTDSNNKLSKWCEYFDIHQDNGRYTEKYKKGNMSRIFNSGLLYAGLTAGEDYLACTTSLALAHNFKVKDGKGNVKNLWDAYTVKFAQPTKFNANGEAIDGNGAYLALIPGYTKMDGTPITAEDEVRFQKLCAGMNFEMQGIYNLDDRSAVQQYTLGSLIIMYRKWIAPAIKRRYFGVSYSALKGDFQEGYHHTLFRIMNQMVKDAKEQVTEEEGAKALLNIVDDMKALRVSVLMNWNKMTDYEKSNVKRSLSELAIVVGLWLACSILGKIPPPDYGDDERGQVLKWWDQTVFSQMLRLRTEIGSQAPTPMLVDEALKILKSPFAAIQPLQNAINGLELFIPSNYFTEIKSGRYRGHVKAYKYFRELPVISMFKKVDNFLDPSPLIQYYKNDSVY